MPEVGMSAVREEYEQALINVVRELTDEQQREVLDFARFLRAKEEAKGKHVPTFSWQGALRDLRDQYTSVELHREATRLMGESD
jgi:hypothetical protein